MGFLDKLADWLAPSVSTPSATVQVAPSPVHSKEALPPVPAELPKIAAKTAPEICMACKPAADARGLLAPEHTPSQFLRALQERRMGGDMIKVLAYGLAERDAVGWAVQSVKRVADKLTPLDAAALRAAELWARSPSAQSRAAAEAAAKRTDFQGPGAWTAQAAAWAASGTGAGGLGGGRKVQPMRGTERLAAHAVQGAVFLAIAKASDGKDGGFEAQHPFIAIGLGIAGGSVPAI